jgi:hypothetical protein
MTARKKRGSSHTWRGILNGREVLEKGLIKRVGDGNTINIWDDQWIPSNPGFKPIYRKPEAQAVKGPQALIFGWNVLEHTCSSG